MNKLDVNQVGGFPMTTRILDEIQKAFAVFNALGAISGDKTIISGCVTVGTNVSAGVVYVNGEIFSFTGGTVQTKVKIVETAETLVFEDGMAKSVIKTRYVTFGTGVDAMDWVDFKKPLETKGLADTFESIGTSLTAIIDKLDTIDEHAKVQLPTDWDQADNTAKDYLKNKPNIINYLVKGAFALGDVNSTDELRTITFPTVGTNNYMVLGCMVSTGSNFSNDNDVMWMVREKTNTSFKITLREVSGIMQSLTFEYMLIPF